ncbi:MAG: EFR1 family ferrodoxin [Eubacteriales bacterium]|nr:EFR1 family ferrodoxin [Eubacteriales bacterium]
MVFYFTATGNCLYVAKSLDSETVSIPQAIDSGRLKYNADRIGIVAPIYGHEMPQMVKAFIQHAKLDTDYLYLVLTYGARHANAVELAQNVFRRVSKQPDYIRTVLMVDNFVPAFDMKEQVKAEKHVEEQIEAIRRDIDAKKHSIELVTEKDRAAHAEYLENVHYRPETIWADFTFTDRCIGCGICTRVCPAGCIHLETMRAVRTGENCQACMACVHVCPKAAIRVNPVCGYHEPNPEARYRNEHVTLSELVAANERKNLREGKGALDESPAGQQCGA